jgi:hypothetical protein
MSLSECMESHTHREFKTWIRWLDEQWNNPTADQYYLMSVAQRVQQVLSKNPNQISLSQQKITFGPGSSKPSLTKDQKASMAKARWASVVGLEKKDSSNV